MNIGVAMSGGVDSTMAASLLLEQGHSVHGFFMELPLAALERQRHRVTQVARQLAIPLTCIDLRIPFTRQVIDYFTTSYRQGLTPNPCIHCNQKIKFGLLAQAMREAGMERIATGHYARLHPAGEGLVLRRGQDPGKDQSYFLARLAASQLHHLVFPLGEWTKEAVYRRAQGLGFAFSGEESQDVCFLTEGLAAFLAGQGFSPQTGEVIGPDGREIGAHQGSWRYTIGQRRGLGLPDATPWYVVGLDGAANQVRVGKKEDLFTRVCPIRDLRWTVPSPPLPWRGLVQLRSRHTPALARLQSTGPELWQLEFDSPQRAVTPGQFAVLYEEDRVLASAVIGAPLPPTPPSGS